MVKEYDENTKTKEKMTRRRIFIFTRGIAENKRREGSCRAFFIVAVGTTYKNTRYFWKKCHCSCLYVFSAVDTLRWDALYTRAGYALPHQIDEQGRLPRAVYARI